MRRQQYRARDKTVRKMGRDGLLEENIRSGDAVRVSGRESDNQQFLRTAADSMNFQERRSRSAEAGNERRKHRSGYSSDFKKPGYEETGNAQSNFYQTEPKKTDSPLSMEVQRETGADAENVQTVYSDGEMIPETKSGVRETSVRQNGVASYSRASGGRKNGTPDFRISRRQRQKKNVQRKYVKQEASYEKEHVSDTMQGNPAEMKMNHVPGAGSDLETVRGNMSASIYGSQDQSSRMKNVRGSQMGNDRDPRTADGAGQDNSHARKKKQVYAHARKMEGQKKAEEGRAALAGREEKRNAGNRVSAEQTLPVIQKDKQKKDKHERIFTEQKKKAGRLQFGEEDGMVPGAGMRLMGRTAAWLQALRPLPLWETGRKIRRRIWGRKPCMMQEGQVIRRSGMPCARQAAVCRKGAIWKGRIFQKPGGKKSGTGFTRNSGSKRHTHRQSGEKRPPGER